MIFMKKPSVFKEKIVAVWVCLQIVYLSLILLSQFHSMIEFRFYDKYIVGALIVLNLFIPQYSSPNTAVSPKSRIHFLPIPSIRLIWIGSFSGVIITLLIYFFGRPNLHYTPQYSDFIGPVPPVVESVEDIFVLGDSSIQDVYFLADQFSDPAYIITNTKTKIDTHLLQEISPYQSARVSVQESLDWQRNTNNMWGTEQEQAGEPTLVFKIEPTKTGEYYLKFELEELDLGVKIAYSLYQDEILTDLMWHNIEDNIDCQESLESTLYCLPTRRIVTSPPLQLEEQTDYYLQIRLIGEYRTRTIVPGQVVGGYASVSTPRLIKSAASKISSTDIDIIKESPHTLSIQINQWQTDQLGIAFHRPYSSAWTLTSDQIQFNSIHGELNVDTNLWVVEPSQPVDDTEPIIFTITHTWWGNLLILAQVFTGISILAIIKDGYTVFLDLKIQKH